MVELFSCRSFYKRDQDIQNISLQYRSNTGLKIWKSWYSLLTSLSEFQTEQPWHKVCIVCKGFFCTDLSLGRKNVVFGSDLFLPLFLPKQVISSAWRVHVFHFSFSCSLRHSVFNQFWKNNMIRWETVHSKTGFQGNDWLLSAAVHGLKQISWCTVWVTLISGWGELFQSVDTSVQISAASKLTVSL